MINREPIHNIIYQHGLADWQKAYQDFGDSCSRTGIMSMTGSAVDSKNMPLFVVNNRLVRYPYKYQKSEPVNGSLVLLPAEYHFNDSSLTSRDNLVQWAAGDNSSVIVRNCILSYAQGWFINKDFLDPSVRLYLYKRAGAEPPLYIKLLGYPLLFMSMFWNSKAQPNQEMNQFTAIMISMGQEWIEGFSALHPDLVGNILSYYNGWRDQPEIGLAYAVKIFDEIEHEY